MHILALDQGTTSSRAIVFNPQGSVVAQAQQEFAQHFPQSGWVEHDAMDIWNSQLAVARQALQQARSKGIEVQALGITNQRETTVLWDRLTGQPLAPAVVWQDRRTADWCDQLRARGHAKAIQRTTGLVLDAYFSGTKLAWLLDHIPNARLRAERGELAFGTVDSWLIWNLTAGAVHATDASNASRTLMLDLKTRQWDEAMLRLLNVPASLLPKVVASSGVLGHTKPEVLGISLPIAGVAGDQQAATFGQACFAPGMAKNTYGTGCFMLMNVGAKPKASRHRLLSTLGWQGPAGPNNTAYCLEGSVFVAGAAVQWLRDGLGLIQQSAEVEALAASVQDTGDVVLVPAFTGLGTPYWDSYARGSLFGLNRGTSRAHIARATLESIALQSADVFAAMSADAGMPLNEIRVDGGASRNDLLMQMQADVSGVTVVRPRVTETTALGAAYLAGLATGIWSGADEISSLWQIDRRFEPKISESQRRQKLERWHEAVQRTRGWARV
jgi:glycerol kinase